ncbi:MAG TPA: membrane protein insertase YidC [Geminicoccaceae bacterium]|nr:membrane protein insertase YidC [Geminicoccaceae bacterium]
MPEQRNLILAIVLSVTIIIAFQYFYELPRIHDARQQQAVRTEQTIEESEQPAGAGTGEVAPSPPGASQGAAGTATPPAAPTEVIEGGDRVVIDSGRIRGSLSLVGGRIDNVILSDYKLTTAPDSPDVALLSPPGSTEPYFVELGWVAAGPSVRVPGPDTVWTADRAELRPGQPVTLSWDNGEGLRFERRLEIDDAYMFTITQRVVNEGDAPVSLYPYGLVTRWGTPKTLGYYILHEGPIGVVNGTLHEIDYDDLQEDGSVELHSQGGWMGFTDKYWLTALVPDQAGELTATFRDTVVDGQDRYQADYLRAAVTVPAGGSVEITDRMFAGAKEVERLDRYREQYSIPLFDRAVDFGWFYFLTKPLFHVLHFFYKWTGNYGVAILLLTLLVKLLFFPLANKSYRAMSKMKKLQPEMMRLREQYGDDKMRMNQELMALYKREKANPVSGCLPIVVQIPVFFALYKVLFVSIEMRQAPFFGWIHDLSAPDPTSVFNLFGLLPFGPPAFLMIGVWPLLMGATMFLQQKLNPQPADPMQARVMMLLPAMFIFLFATFPAGLVIYWTWNNLLSIAQQWTIMKRMGVTA